MGDNGTILHSTNGFNWYSWSVSTTNWFYQVRHLNGVLVLVGENGALRTSTDAGDPMEYHGLRSTYFITTDFALDNMRDDLRIMYDAIYGRLAFNSAASEHVA